MFRLTTLFIGFLICNISVAQFVPQPLKVISPESAGYKAGFTNEVTRELEDSLKALGSFIVWRKGGIIYEQYFHGATENTAFSIKSITKSMVSAPDLDMDIVATTFFNNNSQGRNEKKRLHLFMDKLTGQP